MIDKIVKLLKRLNQEELKDIYRKIESDYALGDLFPNKKRRNNMSRDDITEKITQLLQQDFSWIEVELTEETDLQVAGLDKDCMTIFANILLQEFDLDSIEFSKVMEWQKVSDIVNYIEDALEGRG